MVAIVILCLTKVDGKPIMDYKDAAARGVPWSALSSMPPSWSSAAP